MESNLKNDIKPIRILWVNGGLMNRGGIESFMMNYYRHFDRDLIQIDFIVHKDYGCGYYDNEIRSMGGRIFELPKKSKHPFIYNYKLKRILKDGHYKIIHTHMDAMGAWVLKAAKECRIPVRIAHSHNTQHLSTNPIKLIFLERARKVINRYATLRMACSNEAGKWLFGDQTFQVVYNAIDTRKFYYSMSYRNEIRQKWNIEETDFLIGHVGRFDTQKNQPFLIDAMANLISHYSHLKLMFVGEGPQMDEVRKTVAHKGISDNVIFVGVRDDAYKYYNAFDLFVLPSLFEGLGIVAIEAQINGCLSVLSNKVPSVVNISGNAEFLPLNKNKWIKQIDEIIHEHHIREKAKFDVEETGYDIHQEAAKLQKKYLELWESV